VTSLFIILEANTCALPIPIKKSTVHLVKESLPIAAEVIALANVGLGTLRKIIVGGDIIGMTFCKREIAFTNRRVGATGYNLMRNSKK
tara:strand:+ start:545 stop:808 length:264 start_codon:yes stop_codon:yes gene_type:complete